MSETIPNDLVETLAAELPAEDTIDTTAETTADGSAQTEKPGEESSYGKAVAKRIAKQTFENRNLQRENEALKAMIANKTPGATVPQDFQVEVNKAAAAQAKEAKFVEDSNRTYAAGVAEFPDFAKTVGAYDLIGGLGDKPAFIEAINALPNGHQVFHHLGKNLDAASDILELSPTQMAIKLAQLSGTLAKPVKKPISNAPAPASPLGGSAAISSKDPNKMSMAEYVEWRKTTI